MQLGGDWINIYCSEILESRMYHNFKRKLPKWRPILGLILNIIYAHCFVVPQFIYCPVLAISINTNIIEAMQKTNVLGPFIPGQFYSIYHIVKYGFTKINHGEGNNFAMYLGHCYYPQSSTILRKWFRKRLAILTCQKVYIYISYLGTQNFWN